jgi:hypothetical protein
VAALDRQGRRLFQKHGLDVDLVFAGHPAGIAMVVSGEAQMSSYNLESVMQASVRGASFAVVGNSVSYSDFLCDVVPIIRDEIRALVDEGIRYIQIDAPRYSYLIDPKWRQYVRDDMGVDPELALDEAIRADNTCLAGVAREAVVLAIHLCRDNNRSHWYAEGGYDPIAEKLFNQLAVDTFLLEYESDRAGTFRATPLRTAGQDGRPRPDQEQGPGARIDRRASPPHRRGEPVRAARTSRPQSAVRVCLGEGRQPPHRRRTAAQAATRRRDSAAGVAVVRLGSQRKHKTRNISTNPFAIP